MTNWHGSEGGWGGDAPVFDWDWPETLDGGPDKSLGLPLVWITVQAREPTVAATGRDCIWCYGLRDDPDGAQALAYGADYYNEGMPCDSLTEHAKRVMCFQAAELLYLHASRKGNPFADLNLGYVYSYDRCEGSYWNRGLANTAPITVESLAARTWSRPSRCTCGWTTGSQCLRPGR